MSTNGRQRPYLNVGAGRIILPVQRPAHHVMIDAAIYDYPLWHNVDRNQQPGINQVVDLFTYPWPFEDNSFDGALISHVAEHIPHEIRISDTDRYAIGRGDAKYLNELYWKGYFNRLGELTRCQDGWFAFFAELHRVLTPGAIAHILSPYAWSSGAVNDPSHTRFLTEQTFHHSMQSNPDSPFEYETAGLNMRQIGVTIYAITEDFTRFVGTEADSETIRQEKQGFLELALRTQVNVCSEFYIKLEVVK